MKVMNAATFTVQREDHTIGNVIRMYDLHALHILYHFVMDSFLLPYITYFQRLVYYVIVYIKIRPSGV
jgi:hypothetical protein